MCGLNYPFLTLKERDIETGLDYFLARYYSSMQGRFTGVDPLTASAKSGQPQSWNRYSYCINNPLLYVDPSGLIWGTLSNGNGTASAQWFDTEDAMKQAGYAAMTNFLMRKAHGEGFLSFDRFSNHYEGVSTLAVVAGLLNGETGARTSGVTSQTAPFLRLMDPVPNALDAIYRDSTVQALLNSPEAEFLGTYSGVAGFEYSAGRAFSSMEGLSMEGLAYDLEHLAKHLPGTSESGRLAASKSRYSLVVV